MMVTNDLSIPTEIVLMQAVEALVSAIDARNNIQGHSTHVASYAVQIAKIIGWNDQILQRIEIGALLHDIGQIYWPGRLLDKQGTSLTNEEQKIIKSHTYRGIDLIERWPMLDFVKPFILYHQEWVDGSGYPYGLQGDEIPVEVQVVSLADVYEALRHPRKYKKRHGFSSLESVKIMQEMRGKRWNDEIFDIFAGMAQSL